MATIGAQVSRREVSRIVPQSGYIDGKGLADYSNRGFFTVVQNFGTQDFRHPSANPSDYLTESTNLQYPNLPGTVKMQYLDGYVNDTLQNTRAQIRMTARGVFDDVVTEIWSCAPQRIHDRLQHYGRSGEPPDSACDCIFGRNSGLLLSRSIAVSLPDQQVFSVIDQTQHQCPNACGFSVIKVKLKNVTPVGDSMSNGIVVAVAKFHLNTCYQPDLSGDPGGPRFAPTGCRDAEEHIAVSDPQGLTALTAGSERALTFTFSQPIPINATDIYLASSISGATRERS